MFDRSVLGPELQMVVLEMTLEDQKERLRARHGGSEEVVDMMKVREEHRRWGGGKLMKEQKIIKPIIEIQITIGGCDKWVKSQTVRWTPPGLFSG